MARKKRNEQESTETGGWLNTFADLMNLLLCFFVLLFSMSSVDASKYEAVVASLNSSFSIFTGGGSSIDNVGQLISSGISQLNELETHTHDTGKPVEEDVDTENIDPQEFMEEINKEAVEELYENVTQTVDKEGVDSQLEISIDSNYQYVKLTLSGAILFDSGKAQIKKESIDVLDKVGNILKNYNNNLIKVEGHTDNVPVSKYSQYADNMELSSARAYSVWLYLINEKHLNPKTVEAAGRSEYDPVDDNTTKEGRAKNRRVEFKIYTDINSH